MEIIDRVDLTKVLAWVAYCRAAPTDTRIALGMSDQSGPSVQDLAHLQDNGVGLYLTGGAAVRESLVPMDQGMQGVAAHLPELAALPRAVRELLGPAYEKIGRGDWRDAFQDACQAVEDEARKYLKHWSRTTRIKVQRNTGPHTLAAKKIDRMTMGQLARAFRDIISPNQADTIIGRTLDDVVDDRNLVTHKKRKARTEARLRRNWKGHFWKVVGALKAIYGQES